MSNTTSDIIVDATPEAKAAFLSELQTYVGLEIGAPTPAPDEINAPMIRHLVEAVGDKNPIYTLRSFDNLLQRFGVQVPAQTLIAKNVAVVMVTADIKAFSKNGQRLDVTVSAMGDARSLQGGVLVQTPLYAADGQIYAVAQGALAVGGFIGGNRVVGATPGAPGNFLFPSRVLQLGGKSGQIHNSPK